MPGTDAGGPIGGGRPAGFMPLDRGVRPETDFEGPTTEQEAEEQADEPHSLVSLQHSAGNAAVSSMLAPEPVGARDSSGGVEEDVTTEEGAFNTQHEVHRMG
jgi:hypothetical protein